MTETGCVYTLNDPRTEEPKYVGATIDPSDRYETLLNTPHSDELEEWISELEEAGLEPEMKVVNTVPVEELAEEERELLEDLVEENELLNTKTDAHYPVPWRIRHPEKEPEQRAFATDREVEILRGEANVSENYYTVVVSRVRKRIRRLGEQELEALEAHDTLADELREKVCNE